jgi:hypothetical protein
MRLSMDLAQAIFAFLHVTAADHSHPDKRKARQLADRIWKEAGYTGNPMHVTPCNFLAKASTQF